ncbi:polymorphic toxin-type HINT domain-containing protein, partial [Oerskovia sp. NPDC060338]|uniref:polymorphic toxin-type HINT domain-containing protein n=1 Tax=Oerskovia sp. NPDC060338 TaxID=3347100 RepID=UPI00366160C8
VKKGASAVGKWASKNKAEIIGGVVGTVVGVGCAALTVGWGSVACAVAGGALAGAITNTIRQSSSGKPLSWRSFATETVIGGVFGAVGLGVGAVASRWIAPVANRAVQGAVSAVRASTSRGGQAVASSARGTVSQARNSAAQVAGTKPIQASTPKPSTAPSGTSNARPTGGVKNPTNQSKTPSGCSFSGATAVLMADGSAKRIDQVAPGDKVASTNPENTDGQGAPAGTGEVVAQHVHDDVMVALVVAGESITTTEDHPFWSVTDQRFERADELETGEAVLTATGATATVDGIDLSNTVHAPAYNLTVTTDHTYYVLAGETPILVHNCDDDGRGLWQLTKERSSKVMNGGPFKTTFYKSASDGRWWTPDVTGHGGSAFKVYRETSKGLEWIADATKHGDIMEDKWKGGTGRFIPWGKLRGVKG